jgi:hypothetical protein
VLNAVNGEHARAAAIISEIAIAHGR